jgi:hypothetical protein
MGNVTDILTQSGVIATYTKTMIIIGNIYNILITLLAFRSLKKYIFIIYNNFAITNLQNPDWPGHAKVHMMWFIAYLAYTGFIQIYLIWFKMDKDYPLILGWQLANLCAFWSAVVLAPFYGGAVIDGKYHVEIFGIKIGRAHV